jgi:hypothetical protein
VAARLPEMPRRNRQEANGKGRNLLGIEFGFADA